jgi:hypothetical protein
MDVIVYQHDSSLMQFMIGMNRTAIATSDVDENMKNRATRSY